MSWNQYLRRRESGVLWPFLDPFDDPDFGLLRGVFGSLEVVIFLLDSIVARLV